ncbi:transporter associated domain-containing protein [Sphingomonas sp. 3-13AW]
MYVLRTMPTSKLMEEMRRRDERFAVVTDADGNVEGVVTTTDIFAVIAGDLADDEDDDLIVAASADGMRVRGLARVVDIETHFTLPLGESNRNYETISGHLLAIAGRIPEEGDSFEHEGLRFTVVSVDGRKIELIDIARIKGDGE